MSDADDSAEAATDDGVSPADLARRLDRDEFVTILDIRNRDEIERWAIDGPGVKRTEIPFVTLQAARVNGTIEDLAGEIEHTDVSDRTDGDGSERTVGTDQVIVVCGRGEVSATVADLLVETGIDAHNLAGGMDAWGEVYTARRLDALEIAGGEASVGSEATVYQYRRPATGCLSYLIVASGQAAVIDPLSAFAGRYVADAAAHDASLTAAIDTHVHADHVSGLRELGERGVEAILPERAADRGVAFDVRTVADGETVVVGDAALEAVSLPGHTSGMTGFILGDLLLAGDSVFVDGIARPDLEASAEDAGDHRDARDVEGMEDTEDAEDADGMERTEALARELHETLTARLARFDDGTMLAPGHHGEGSRPNDEGTYIARLGDVRDRLPAFETDKRGFVERVCGDLGARPANHERIVRANLGLERLDTEEARTLELGPNNCAAGPMATE